MYCNTKFFLILCAIPLIEAIGLKIDGLLNIGDNWNYEYRIVRTDSSDRPRLRAENNAQDKAKEVPQQKNEDVPRQIDVEAVFNKENEKVRKREEEIARNKEKDSPSESYDEETEIAGQTDEDTARDMEKEIARQRDEEIAHHEDKIARLNDEEAARIQRDEEHLSLAENVLRKEADRLRKEALSPKLDQRQGRVQGGQLHYIHNTNKLKTIGTTEARTPKQSKHKINMIASTETSSNSDESDDSQNQKKETILINDDATENPKKLLRDATDYSDTQCSSDSRDEESLYSSETSASFIDKTRQGIERQEADASTSSNESSVNIIKIDSYTTPKHAKEHINKTLQDMVNKTILQGENKTGDALTSSKVTTVRTEEIFTDAHLVKDDAAIIEFTIYLYEQALKIFGRIKTKTNQDHVKKNIDKLKKSYQEKFLEFLSVTKNQTIKTRLGTQKVILNTMDTSNHLLRRLMNIMVSDLDKKGILRHNVKTAKSFQKAIELEQKQLAMYACRKFAICRSGPGFTSFILEVMDILLKCNDTKLKQSMDAFTESIKYMYFDYILAPETEKRLKLLVDKAERQNVIVLRAVVMVLKNTIISQNKPIIVSHYLERRNIVNSTLAFLEIIDLLDTHIPRNRTNVMEWADMKLSLEDFADDKRSDIQDIMTTIIRHVTKNLRALSAEDKTFVSKNVDMVLSVTLRSDDYI